MYKSDAPLPIINSPLIEVNDKIYVFFSNYPVIYLYEFDPQDDIWSLKASPSDYRPSFGLINIGDKIYAISGGNPPLNSVEVYSITEDAWSYVAPINNPRFNMHTITYNNMIYVFGGQNPNVLNSVEVFDPVINIWTELTPMPGNGSLDFSAELHKNIIYIIGGSELPNRVLEYNPGLNRWFEKPSLKWERPANFFTLSVNNMFYVLGGDTYPNSFEKLEPQTTYYIHCKE